MSGDDHAPKLPQLSWREVDRLWYVFIGHPPVMNDSDDHYLRHLGLVEGEVTSPRLTELGRAVILADGRIKHRA